MVNVSFNATIPSGVQNFVPPGSCSINVNEVCNQWAGAISDVHIYGLVLASSICLVTVLILATSLWSKQKDHRLLLGLAAGAIVVTMILVLRITGVLQVLT